MKANASDLANTNSNLNNKVNASDITYFTKIRYGVKWFSTSENKTWVNIALADFGFPNSVLANYPCVVALPQMDPNDSANINADVQVMCAKMTTDRKNIILLLNRAFSNGLIFAVWFIVD